MNFLAKACLFVGTISLGIIMLKLFNDSSKEPITVSDFQNNEKNILISNKSESNPVQNNTKKKKFNKKRKRQVMSSDVTMKIAKLKPNFFLAFQVCNSEIHSKVKRLQEKIVGRNPLLHSALVNVSTLHVTLAVTHLENDKSICLLKEKLDSWANQNIKLLFEKPIVLNFTGVKTFGNTVAYVDIEKCSNYEKVCNLSKILNNLLEDTGLMSDSKSFTPHLTLLKLSKDINLARAKKKFLSEFQFATECTDTFGSEVVRHIQLLSMSHEKDEHGYYKCFHQINITDSQTKMDHSECCTPIPKPDKN